MSLLHHGHGGGPSSARLRSPARGSDPSRRHDRLEHDTLGPLAEHRYVMVVAVRVDHRRSGIGTVLLESALAEMERDGVLSASWLVHPANLASAAFIRRGFPDADETYPPDDRPYARFTLRL